MLTGLWLVLSLLSSSYVQVLYQRVNIYTIIKVQIGEISKNIGIHFDNFGRNIFSLKAL